ncbi:MAG: hypothetical protein L6V81_02505 [Clostridium sp.]|nr:MAG: hypothetical protein L6V81_02505 [Clostridium sp.]
MPLILIFDRIGLPAYTATIVSTIIGYSISITIALIYLKKEMKFTYRPTIDLLKKLILPSICLIVPLTLSKKYLLNLIIQDILHL